MEAYEAAVGILIFGGLVAGVVYLIKKSKRSSGSGTGTGGSSGGTKNQRR